MARGREEHHARRAAVSALGRELARRARSCCELCRDNGKLLVVEVAPTFDEPSVERAMLACARCRELLDGGLRRADPQTLRFLGETVWSDVLPAQLAAVRLVRSLAGAGIPWALEANEHIWLDEGIEALI